MKKLLLLALTLVLLGSCEPSPQPEKPKPVTYQVIERSKDVGSHYNWFTNKQVIGTEYIMVLKNQQTGYTFARSATADEYYRFKENQTFIVNAPYYEDKSLRNKTH